MALHDPLTLAEDAARLLAHALRPTARPAKDPEYARLLQRFRAEAEMREYIAVIARGLGLIILGHSSQGLVLGAEGDGPFALQLGDYRRSALKVNERMAHGLIQLAIAAWYFPNARALEDMDEVAGARASVRGLVEYIVGICEEFKSNASEDALADAPELDEAWRTILALAPARGSKTKRRTAGSLDGMIGHALDFLASHGLVRKITEGEEEYYQALGAYRMHVREMAAHQAAIVVRKAAQRADLSPSLAAPEDAGSPES